MLKIKIKNKKLNKLIATFVLICFTSTMGGLGIFYPKKSQAFLGIGDIEVGSVITAFENAFGWGWQSIKEISKEALIKIIFSTLEKINDEVYKNVTKKMEDAYLIKDWSKYLKDVVFDTIIKVNNEVLERGYINEKVYKILPQFESFFAEKLRDKIQDGEQESFSAKTLQALAQELDVTPDSMSSAVGTNGYFVQMADLANKNAFNYAIRLASWSVDQAIKGEREYKADEQTGSGYKANGRAIEDNNQTPEGDGLVLQTQLTYQPSDIISKLEKMGYKNIGLNNPKSIGELSYDPSYKFDSGIDITMDAGKLEVQATAGTTMAFIFIGSETGGQSIVFAKNQDTTGDNNIANQLRKFGYLQTGSIPSSLQQGEFTISPPYDLSLEKFIDYFAQTEAFGLIKIQVRVKKDADDPTNEYIARIYQNYNTDDDTGNEVNEITFDSISNLPAGHPDKLQGLVKIYDKQFTDKTLQKYLLAPLQKGGKYDLISGILTQPATKVHNFADGFLKKQLANMTDKDEDSNDKSDKLALKVGDFLGTGISSMVTTKTDPATGCPVLDFQKAQFSIPDFTEELTKKISVYPKCFINTTAKILKGSLGFAAGALKDLIGEILCLVVNFIPGISHLIHAVGLCGGDVPGLSDQALKDIDAIVEALKEQGKWGGQIDARDQDPKKTDLSHPWDIRIPYTLDINGSVSVEIKGVSDTGGGGTITTFAVGTRGVGQHIAHWNGTARGEQILMKNYSTIFSFVYNGENIIQGYEIALSDWLPENPAEEVGSRVYADAINIITKNQEGLDAISQVVHPGDFIKLAIEFTSNGWKDLNIKYDSSSIMIQNPNLTGETSLKANAVRSSQGPTESQKYLESQFFQIPVETKVPNTFSYILKLTTNTNVDRLSIEKSIDIIAGEPINVVDADSDGIPDAIDQFPDDADSDKDRLIDGSEQATLLDKDLPMYRYKDFDDDGITDPLDTGDLQISFNNKGEPEGQFSPNSYGNIKKDFDGDGTDDFLDIEPLNANNFTPNNIQINKDHISEWQAEKIMYYVLILDDQAFKYGDSNSVLYNNWQGININTDGLPKNANYELRIYNYNLNDLAKKNDNTVNEALTTHQIIYPYDISLRFKIK